MQNYRHWNASIQMQTKTTLITYKSDAASDFFAKHDLCSVQSIFAYALEFVEGGLFIQLRLENTKVFLKKMVYVKPHFVSE